LVIQQNYLKYGAGNGWQNTINDYKTKVNVLLFALIALRSNLAARSIAYSLTLRDLHPAFISIVKSRGPKTPVPMNVLPEQATLPNAGKPSSCLNSLLLPNSPVDQGLLCCKG
jgi:hypothetical protein